MSLSLDQAVWILLFTAIVFANIPWILSNRLFIAIKLATKPFWVGVVEWLVYFFILGLLALGLEMKVMGNNSPQDWEFYATNIFLFAIFAFPGFIYRYNLKSYLDKGSK